ncbi:hypothetical protein EV426DRAFT_579104 [Tirmania nivea]|nr:hypothetical protein EV426DRAFT_579104 [Tirmania nivea]
MRVFICLVVATIQHYLKELKSREKVTETIEFKYKTTATSFHHLQNIWGLYDNKVRILLLANIKVDLYISISEFDKKAEMEVIEEIAESVEDNQNEESTTEGDEFPEIDKDKDW